MTKEVHSIRDFVAQYGLESNAAKFFTAACMAYLTLRVSKRWGVAGKGDPHLAEDWKVLTTMERFHGSARVKKVFNAFKYEHPLDEKAGDEAKFHALNVRLVSSGRPIMKRHVGNATDGPEGTADQDPREADLAKVLSEDPDGSVFDDQDVVPLDEDIPEDGGLGRY